MTQTFHHIWSKFCLNLAAKLSSAYKDIFYDSTTGSGLIVLLSLRTLHGYKNYIKPRRGFNPHVINDLGNTTASFSEIERYVTILLAEVKIQEDSVWNKHAGELIGFVDLGAFIQIIPFSGVYKNWLVMFKFF